MKKSRSIASFIIIICLAVSSFICSKGILEEGISKRVDSWLSGQPELFTSDFTPEQQIGFISALSDFSKDHSFILISQNKTPQQSGASLYTFNFFTSPAMEGISFDPLVVLDTMVVDKTLLQKVIDAGIGAYAGYGDYVFSRVADMPSIRSGVYFHVEKLGLGDRFGSSCKILGLSQGEFQQLVDNIASSTGCNKENLTTKMSGTASDFGLVYLLSSGTFIILSIVFCLFMVTRALFTLKTLGVYMMLGWSKRDFVSRLFSAQLTQLLVVVPVCALGTCVILDGFALNFNVFEYTCLAMIPTISAVLLSLGIGALPLVFAKPIDAILYRYSRRGFYVASVAVYLICLGAIFMGCVHANESLALYMNTIRTRSAWSEYADWHVLEDFWVGDTRFTGRVESRFDKDMYEWYAAHEHDEGVFLAQARHYRDNTVRAYLPEGSRPKPFWYLAASPSYLREVGVDVSDADVAKAESGVRVHLLPKSFSTSQADGVKELLRKHSKCYKSNITTAFMKNPRFEFSSYSGKQQLFTWSIDAKEPVTADNFVIAVITANNMVPSESESLVASGLQNDYVKLNKKGASHCLDDKGMAFLPDGLCKVRFPTITNYIDGLQKTFEDLLLLFSAVLIMMMVAIVVMIACLINVVNMMSAKEIGVKYVLGFSAWDMYKKEILFVNLTILVGIAACAVLSSVAGMIVGSVLFLISNFVILTIVRRKSPGAILELVSKE